MKKLLLNNNNNNTVGVAAMQAEGYELQIASEEKKQNTEFAWWSSPAFIIFLTVSMSVLDALVLYDILDQAMTQAEYMGKIVSFGVALVLNMIPLLIAKFAHQAIYRIKKYALVWTIVAIIAFTVLFSATVMLRFAYMDQYGEADINHITNEMVVQEETEQHDGGVDPKGLAVVILLSVEPLVTSVVNFCLAFISDDELRKRINHLRKRRFELAEAKSDLRAYIETAENPLNWAKRALQADMELKASCEEDIRDRGDILKARARFYLAEYLRDPESVSYITGSKTKMAAE